MLKITYPIKQKLEKTETMLQQFNTSRISNFKYLIHSSNLVIVNFGKLFTFSYVHLKVKRLESSFQQLFFKTNKIKLLKYIIYNDTKCIYLFIL